MVEFSNRHKESREAPPAEVVEEVVDFDAADGDYLDEGLPLYCGIYMSLHGTNSPLLQHCRKKVQAIEHMPEGWVYFGNSWICPSCHAYFEEQEKLHRKAIAAELMA